MLYLCKWIVRRSKEIGQRSAPPAALRIIRSVRRIIIGVMVGGVDFARPKYVLDIGENATEVVNVRLLLVRAVGISRDSAGSGNVMLLGISGDHQ
jgi:hypothetical protein